MSKYGQAAEKAVHLLATGKPDTPDEAWEIATMEIFGAGLSQAKGCPKNAFLGLCEEGRVKGVAPGSYCRSEDNKSYALKAADLLIADETLVNLTSTTIWKKVLKGLGIKRRISHNAQVDVVKNLFLYDLLQ
jgi:hypothetical protein